eukprot:CAMPEP_0197623250 /NCGR_PEP_ID=MMETSP1338-20131121/3299_1 /TAXON_ID=43686 ORGANISM="Pelagodinium beii, Strain RCC1491" /NCGR_SAMPLE_ID=MMETSP1338 /ASSEMBLY_ACC=CAM_ASM_000754 /LENGTH=347 /DNA_ID=CAMNT_0043193161 /DNA_START=39 /DNA_END=1082 /DNA_ORIENTATION=-
MAMLGAAAALTAGAAAAAVALQQNWCMSGAEAVLVPVKKRASTATTASCEAYLSIPEMLVHGKRHITLVGDMLMYAQEVGKAEGSVHLQGAQVTWHFREVRATKESEVLISLTFDTEDEAEFWSEKIRTSSMMSENLPKLFSMQRRQLQNLGQRNQEISKHLSTKRRECLEVERKARSYEEVVGQRSQEVRDLEARAADFQEMATQREMDLQYLREQLEVEKKRFLEERASIETKVQDLSEEVDLRQNEVAELSAEVITAETEAEEKEMQLQKLADMHGTTADQMAMVQERLRQMQELLDAHHKAEQETEDEEEEEEEDEEPEDRLESYRHFPERALPLSCRLHWDK